jgi:hypothetical protein
MGERGNTLNRGASEAEQIQSKGALAMAKRVARSRLKRIFAEELKQREAEQQHSMPHSVAAEAKATVAG